MVVRLVSMPMPLDPQVSRRELIDGEVVPDEEERKHLEAVARERKYVLAGVSPPELPRGIILKIGIEAIVYLRDWREHHRPRDASSPRPTQIVLERLWLRPPVARISPAFLPAVNVGIDDRQVHIRLSPGDHVSGMVSGFLQ
jgi:hypothetical protein